MVESNAAKSASQWAKGATILAGIAVASALVAPAFYVQDMPNALTEDQIQTSVQKAIALQGLDVNVTEGPKTIAIYEEIFQEDAWKAEAEVLAQEELEDDNYENLYDYMVDEDGLNLSIENERDIDRIIVKDVVVRDIEVDDKDAEVELELKVYYEDMDGDSRKEYITATATIEDGEVEDLVFAETA